MEQRQEGLSLSLQLSGRVTSEAKNGSATSSAAGSRAVSAERNRCGFQSTISLNGRDSNLRNGRMTMPRTSTHRLRRACAGCS